MDKKEEPIPDASIRPNRDMSGKEFPTLKAVPKASLRPDWNVPATKFEMIPGKEKQQYKSDRYTYKNGELKCDKQPYFENKDYLGDAVIILWHLVYLPLMIVTIELQQAKRKLLNYIKSSK